MEKRMQIRVKNRGIEGIEGREAATTVEVVDPSDGAITHMAVLDSEEQITVTATSAHSPADIEFGEVGAIPAAAEPEPDAETEAENEQKVAEQPTPPEDEQGDDDTGEGQPGNAVGGHPPEQAA